MLAYINKQILKTILKYTSYYIFVNLHLYIFRGKVRDILAIIFFFCLHDIY